MNSTTMKRRPSAATLQHAGHLAARVVATLFPVPPAMRPIRQVATTPTRRTVPRR